MNNNQIDNTSYYALPCGRQLEDFIWYKKLDFHIGSALKYKWRAGYKDGESFGKDYKKIMHYVRFVVVRTNKSVEEVEQYVESLYNEALEWDGVER